MDYFSNCHVCSSLLGGTETSRASDHFQPLAGAEQIHVFVIKRRAAAAARPEQQ